MLEMIYDSNKSREKRQHIRENFKLDLAESYNFIVNATVLFLLVPTGR